jgi:hypothetical protein
MSAAVDLKNGIGFSRKCLPQDVPLLATTTTGKRRSCHGNTG